MAIHDFAGLAGTVLAGFDADSDALNFSFAYPAAGLRIAASGADTLVSHGAQSVLLAGVALAALTGDHFHFEDGSLAVFGSDLEDDWLSGTGYDDWMSGGAGADTMSGWTGNDTYIVDNRGDTVSEAEGGGIDLIIASVPGTLGAHIENAMVAGGSGLHIRGNGLANAIQGGAGNDTLEGLAGADALVGGGGDDRYIVDAQDTVTELKGGGTDTVMVSFSRYVMPSYVDNLYHDTSASAVLTGNGSANLIRGDYGSSYQVAGGGGADIIVTMDGKDTLRGGDDNDKLEGWEGADKLYGDGGKDTLNGAWGNDVLDGGTGADSMLGGDDNDTYYVDHKSDVTKEVATAGNGGVDTVVSSVSRVLGSYLDNLTLTGTGALAGTGNSLDNVIRGNSGNNVIDGRSGSDTLVGGKGNDTYHVDTIWDVIVEARDGGTDVVISTGGYKLGAYQEHLTLTGKEATWGHGNTLANRIIGTSGHDTLTGGGGRDTLTGGKGNDTYHMDADDVIVEARSGGKDLVVSTGNRTLGQYEEDLAIGGTRGYKGTGNALDNRIDGSKGGDWLDGAGGTDWLYGLAGNDTLRGGAEDDTLIGGIGKDSMAGGDGYDWFIFDRASDSVGTTFDVITDFGLGGDMIFLEAIYAGTLRWMGQAAFTQGVAGQARYEYDARSKSVMLYASTDTDTSAEFALQLKGVTSLSEADVWL